MILVEEAKELLFGRIEKSQPIELSLKEAFGFVLSEEILSPIDLPLFDSSSMDGYAVARNGSSEQKVFEVIGEIKAGDGSTYYLKPGQAIQIFTGALVPSSADGIVIQEKVELKNGSIYLSEEFRNGAFIRKKGSQIKQGELVLLKGTFLNPACIGLLASLGIETATVYTKPKVSLIVSGDEIVSQGNDLKAGEIYESNSFTLQTALQQMRINLSSINNVRDDKNELKNKIVESLHGSEMVLITGGISVGKYDFVLEVLNELNVQTLFYKVSQKPGKPFFVGTINNKWIFAMPGNPASALVCFYEYVYPAIRIMYGIENAALPTMKVKLLKDISKNEGRALFIRAKKTDDGVLPLDGQDSAMLRSFAEANVLIYIPKDCKDIKQDELVEVHVLPFNN
jgi:molybdopterin molybdotransferase